MLLAEDILRHVNPKGMEDGHANYEGHDFKIIHLGGHLTYPEGTDLTQVLYKGREVLSKFCYGREGTDLLLTTFPRIQELRVHDTGNDWREALDQAHKSITASPTAGPRPNMALN
jgi:hypothetical protein